MRLQAALGAAYRIERELGGGGMSRVFVAEEVELGRRVVIKVLAPELAAGVSVDRFKREIQLAASLQHPHIVPLLAAGQAEELLYYTMPLIEGESLRAKLAREGALPISDTVRILRDVADALAYAHKHGVAHRDIKPDNVLLSNHHAVVTDFGVAKALSESAGKNALTSAGVALGTPAYMAPEQAAADPHTDHRCDIYAVGALAYEMLTGRPPFTGTTPQAVLAAHLNEQPAPVTRHRVTVPRALAESVMRCLEKNPADRFQTAEELLHLLEAMATPSGGTMPVTAVERARRLFPVAVVAGLVALTAAGIAVWKLGGKRVPSGQVDANVVAVFPFRVSGDASLAYLREGMVDLLAAKLTGEGGPRASDSRSVLAAWRRAGGADGEDLPEDRGLEVARRVGAGNLLLGEVVGTPTRLVLSASLVSVPSGRRRSGATVEGSPDSVPVLIDRLAGQLLLGEQGRQLGAVTSTSLPALRAYLAGQAAYRRGRYREAYNDFDRALQFDSTFALAALGLVSAGEWLGAETFGLELVRARPLRDRLAPRDRAVLNAFAAAPGSDWLSVELATAESAAAAAPDRPEAWYLAGDHLFHDGPVLGRSDGQLGALPRFRRALELDSSYAAPLSHVLQLVISQGDTAEIRRVARLYFAADSAGELADFLRWRTAIALGDSVTLAVLRAHFDRVNPASVARILGYGQLDGVGLEDVQRAGQAWLERAGTREEQQAARLALHDLAMNRGRPTEARRLLDQLRGVEANPHAHLWQLVMDASFDWGGDTAAARDATRDLVAGVERESPSDVRRRDWWYDDVCVTGLWHLAHGGRAAAARAMSRLRGASAVRDSLRTLIRAQTCAAVVDATLADLEHRPGAVLALERADSLQQLGPPFGFWGNFVVARLWEGHGERRSALAAVRRRPYHWDPGPFLLSTFLREEGRLAALTGDREGAVRAYRHYLILRSDPEPSVKPEVDQVRAELARLLGEPRR